LVGFLDWLRFSYRFVVALYINRDRREAFLEKGFDLDLYRMLAYEWMRTFVAPWVMVALGVTSQGADNVPAKGGVLIVSNQRSVWDQMIIMNEIDRFIYFYSGSRSTISPVFRTIYRMAEIMNPVGGQTRGSEFTEEVVGILKGGNAVCVFPEGIESLMRPDASEEVTYFRTGFALMAIEAGVPIVPVAIITTGKFPSFLPANVAKAISTGRARRLSRIVPQSKVLMRVGKPIDLSGFMDKPLSRKDVEAIAGKVRKIIIKLYSGEDLDRFLTGEKPFDIYTDRI